MSNVDFEDRDTSIPCYDGLCDHCEDQLCEHRCHYRDLTWKRRLESALLHGGIFLPPAIVVDRFVEATSLRLFGYAFCALLALRVGAWFEKDWEDAS